MSPAFCYDTYMEGFTANKKTPENARLDTPNEIEILPNDLTPEQEAELRKALISIDSPNTQKKNH